MGKIIKFSICAMTAIALSTLVAIGADAQSVRTFVSGHGSDDGTCGLGAPCRSFAYAITQTEVSGEITVLDSAGYGAVTINKSITITNPGGVEAAITETGTVAAITISAASYITVTLRGLTLDGAKSGVEGILVTSTAGGTLRILDCVIKDFQDHGIDIETTGTGPTNIVIANSFSLNNGGTGLRISPQGTGTIAFSLNESTVAGNTNGVVIVASSGNMTGVISGSHVDQNSNWGIMNQGGVNENIYVKHSTLIANGANDLLVSSGEVGLFDTNTIVDAANTGGFLATDGTNNITVSSGTLTKQAPK
jgi:hypothetical protein